MKQLAQEPAGAKGRRLGKVQRRDHGREGELAFCKMVSPDIPVYWALAGVNLDGAGEEHRAGGARRLGR